MQTATLPNHELPGGWPQIDSHGTVHNGMWPVGRSGDFANAQPRVYLADFSHCTLDRPCKTPFRPSLKRESSRTDFHCQSKKQCVQSQEPQPILETHDGSPRELQEGGTFRSSGHTPADTVNDKMEIDMSGKEACFGMVMMMVFTRMETG